MLMKYLNNTARESAFEWNRVSEEKSFAIFEYNPILYVKKKKEVQVFVIQEHGISFHLFVSLIF